MRNRGRIFTYQYKADYQANRKAIERKGDVLFYFSKNSAINIAMEK